MKPAVSIRGLSRQTAQTAMRRPSGRSESNADDSSLTAGMSMAKQKVHEVA